MDKDSGKKKGQDGELPGQQEQELMLEAGRSFAASGRFSRTRLAMQALSAFPPQSLLLEGGNAQERSQAALYWAALLNCPQAREAEQLSLAQNVTAGSAPAAPCLECSVCLRFISRMHRDLFFFNGREDSIKIEAVREMRAVLGEPPREACRRVVVFLEGQSMGEAVANSLLKSLEEPKEGTVFVLTAPQRERLLQTLVSRSWVLTLPWQSAHPNLGANDAGGHLPAFPGSNEDLALVAEWGAALLDFAAGGQAGKESAGRGWMERTAKRGALDAALAMQIVLLCQVSLVRVLSGNFQNNDSGTPMSNALAALAPASKRILNEVLAECQDSLNFNVNPVLVIDWLATRLFFIFSGDKKR